MQLLALSLWLTQLPFLYSPDLPTHDGTTHSELGPLHQSATKGIPTDMTTGQSNGGNCSNEVPSSQVCQVGKQD